MANIYKKGIKMKNNTLSTEVGFLLCCNDLEEKAVWIGQDEAHEVVEYFIRNYGTENVLKIFRGMRMLGTKSYYYISKRALECVEMGEDLYIIGMEVL